MLSIWFYPFKFTLKTFYHGYKDTHPPKSQINGYTAPIKGLDTYSFKGFSWFLHCIIIVKTSKLWNTTWKHVVTKKVLNKSKIYFTHSWHSLSQLHLECFSISLEGVPTYAEHLLAALPSLSGPTHPKPSKLGWGWVTVEARSSDAALHHSPSWSNSPYPAWRCVGSLSCWKTNDSPTKPKPDGMAYRCRILW